MVGGIRFLRIRVLLVSYLVVFFLTSEYRLCGMWFRDSVRQMLVVLSLYIRILMFVVRLNVD